MPHSHTLSRRNQTKTELTLLLTLHSTHTLITVPDRVYLKIFIVLLSYLCEWIKNSWSVHLKCPLREGVHGRKREVELCLKLLATRSSSGTYSVSVTRQLVSEWKTCPWPVQPDLHILGFVTCESWEPQLLICRVWAGGCFPLCVSHQAYPQCKGDFSN